MTVSWGAATDAETAQSALQYKLVYSTSNNLSSAANAEANGTVGMNWTANTLSQAVSGLSTETTYYFAVLIKDGSDLVSYQTGSTSTLCAGKMIYLASINNAAFGGKAGGDTKCSQQKPSTLAGTAKALLYDSANGRRACSGADCTGSSTGQLDWPIAASQNYCTKDYVRSMGTSNAVGYLNITLSNSLASSSTYTFTGLSGAFAGSNNCSDWTVYANPAIGHGGRANLTGVNFTSFGDYYCTTNGSIYCVEQ